MVEDRFQFMSGIDGMKKKKNFFPGSTVKNKTQWVGRSKLMYGKKKKMKWRKKSLWELIYS